VIAGSVTGPAGLTEGCGVSPYLHHVRGLRRSAHDARIAGPARSGFRPAKGHNDQCQDRQHQEEERETSLVMQLPREERRVHVRREQGQGDDSDPVFQDGKWKNNLARKTLAARSPVNISAMLDRMPLHSSAISMTNFGSAKTNPFS